MIIALSLFVSVDDVTSSSLVREDYLLLLAVVVLGSHPSQGVPPPGLHQPGLDTIRNEPSEDLRMREELVEVPADSLIDRY